MSVLASPRIAFVDALLGHVGKITYAKNGHLLAAKNIELLISHNSIRYPKEFFIFIKLNFGVTCTLSSTARLHTFILPVTLSRLYVISSSTPSSIYHRRGRCFNHTHPIYLPILSRWCGTTTGIQASIIVQRQSDKKVYYKVENTLISLLSVVIRHGRCIEASFARKFISHRVRR